MQRHLFYTLLLLIATFAIGITGCAKKDNNTIKIGVAGVMTGPDGAIGGAMINGTQIAIEEWNAKGGVLGKKIQGVVRDDEGRPEKAVSVARELIANQVVAVIGNFNSGCTIPSSQIYNQVKIVQITPGSTNPQVTEQGFTHLFRIVGRDDQQGSIAAKFMRQKLGLTKIAILSDKTAYGEGFAKEVQNTFTADGGQVVVYDGVPRTELDFRANIAVIKKSGAQALLWGGMYGQSGPLYLQLRQAGLDIPFVSGNGTMDPNFLDTAGANATNVYVTFGPDYENLPSAQPFLQKYRARFGKEGAFSVYGYDAANVLFEAIEAAGTTDADKIAEVMHSKTFNTILGSVAFNEKGDLKESNDILWTVKDAKFVPAP
jgi:branched-chain amino acid transport system substrate-binding protein